MNWLQAILDINWTDPNLRWVLTGSTLLGVAAATLGCFAFLRGRSLIGDALAHASLPGVCMAFLFAEWGRSRGWFNVDSKSLWLLLIGASFTGMVAAWCISFVSRHSRIKEDAAQAIVLSVFFGGGVVLLSIIKSGNQSGLDKFLWGQAALLVASDVRLMAVVAIVLCALVFLLYKELKLLCFDREFGNGLGLPMQRLDGLLLMMIVASAVIGLQAVGVVLISALLIIPPAAARFWTDKLHRMVPLAAILGGASGVLGVVLSDTAPRMPTGPLVVLSATVMFVISLLFAPQRGVVARLWRLFSTRRLVRRENVLRDLFEITEKRLPGTGEAAIISAEHLAQFEGVSLHDLQANRGGHGMVGITAFRSTLRELARVGLVEQTSADHWRLTAGGVREAHGVVRRHRLWSLFLMYETSLGTGTVDRNADAVEHFLPPEAVEQLETMLRQNGLEPRLKPIS